MRVPQVRVRGDIVKIMECPKCKGLDYLESVRQNDPCVNCLKFGHNGIRVWPHPYIGIICGIARHEAVYEIRLTHVCDDCQHYRGAIFRVRKEFVCRSCGLRFDEYYPTNYAGSCL